MKNAAFDNYLGVDTRKQMRGDPGDLVIISDDVTQEFVASVELLSSDQIITID